MADDRAKRIKRILTVQEQLQRAEEWRLSEIEQRITSLETDQHDLIAGLNSETGLQGLFMDATVRRVKSLQEDARKTSLMRNEQAQRVLETGARLKAAERLLGKAEAEADRIEEESQLREATERLAAQAPGKITDR